MYKSEQKKILFVREHVVKARCVISVASSLVSPPPFSPGFWVERQLVRLNQWFSPHFSEANELPPGRTLFVTNLAFDCTEVRLRRGFIDLPQLFWDLISLARWKSIKLTWFVCFNLIAWLRPRYRLASSLFPNFSSVSSSSKDDLRTIFEPFGAIQEVRFDSLRRPAKVEKNVRLPPLSSTAPLHPPYPLPFQWFWARFKGKVISLAILRF